MIGHDLGDIAEGKRLASDEDSTTVETLHGDLGKLLRRVDRLLVEDVEALVDRVDEPAGTGEGGLEESEGRHLERIAGGGDDLAQRHVARRQLAGVDQHLKLLVAKTPDRDIGDPVDTEQARQHHPARQHRHLDGCQLRRTE